MQQPKSTPRPVRPMSFSSAREQAATIVLRHKVNNNALGHTTEWMIDAVEEALTHSGRHIEVDFYTHVQSLQFDISNHDHQGGLELDISYQNTGELQKRATLIGSRDALWELYLLLGRRLTDSKRCKPQAPEPVKRQGFFSSILTVGVWMVLLSLIIVWGIA